MNWRAFVLSGVLVAGLSASFAPQADARHHRDDRYDDRCDEIYDDYDDPYYDRSGYDRYDRSSQDDGYYGSYGGADQSFDWKRDWPLLLGAVLLPQP